MNRLIISLANNIQKQIKTIIMDSDEDARFSLIGCPTYLLRKLMDYYQSSGGLVVEINEVNYPIPVFLLEDVDDEPSSKIGGSCNDAYLTKIRNVLPRFLVLIPVYKLESKSISSSVTMIDMQSPLHEQVQVKNSLIRNMINEVLAEKGCNEEIFIDIIVQLLKNARAVDEHINDNATQWAMVERLLDVGNLDNISEDEIVAVCGLPYMSKNRGNFKKAIVVINNIKDSMVNKGLNSFFGDLVNSTEEIFHGQEKEIGLIKEALIELMGHLNDKITTAQEFEIAPLIYYTPYSTIEFNSTLPSWWKVLSVELWDKLLEEDLPEKLKFEVCNPLYQVKKKHPIVVRDVVSFKLVAAPVNIEASHAEIHRSKGGSSSDKIGQVRVHEGEVWQDDRPPLHSENGLRYKFSIPDQDLKDFSIRVISLDNCNPGVTIDSRMAKSITPFKKDKVKQAQTETWKCEMTLAGKDIRHSFDLYVSSKVSLNYEISYKEQNKEHKLIDKGGDKKYFELDIDEDGKIEITGVNNETNEKFLLCVKIVLEDFEAVGVTSWYEKMTLLLDDKSSNMEKYRIDFSLSLIQQLTSWIFDNEKSYKPLIMGYDCHDNWNEPIWDSMPIMSSYYLSNDFRPIEEKFDPPTDLIKYRNLIREKLSEHDTFIEFINLGELAVELDLQDSVLAYIFEYMKWLKEAPNVAPWFDLIAIVKSEATGAALSQQPDAIMLNPMHPIRLGWQFLAQEIMYRALLNQDYCPVAGFLDPCSTPDCMMLPCWTPGQLKEEYFISVPTNNAYWSVLWNGNLIERIGDKEVGALFNDRFGIKLDGIESGFSAAQIYRALSDVAKILSAKTNLKIKLYDDTTGGDSLNAGIAKWASSFLGYNDPWNEAGMKTLEIFDKRNKKRWPSTRKISILMEDSLGSLRWFEDYKKDKGFLDLTIISHLGSMNPGLTNETIQTAVGKGALIRKRIRKQLSTTSGSQVVSESRQSLHPRRDENSLCFYIESLSSQLEKTCGVNNSYIFEPKINLIENALKESRFCTISSSTIDPSCFFKAGDSNYLWDFDLPNNYNMASANVGYYLVASATQAIKDAVRSNILELTTTQYEISDKAVENMLIDISSRGFPTLKKLAARGTTSSGEIGLLIALKVLQNRIADEKMFPLMEGSRVNLLIPLDPFKSIISSYKNAIGSIGSRESRPDIIAVSILFDNCPIAIKITPIEVKLRSGTIDKSNMESALTQASNFALFLKEIKEKASVEDIWQYAFSNLLTNMLDFSFRVNSSCFNNEDNKKWSDVHSRVISSIMKDSVEWIFDHRGRLIIIDKSDRGIQNIDKDNFRETLGIKIEDGIEIILNEHLSFLDKVKEHLNDWDLLACLKLNEADEQEKKLEAGSNQETEEQLNMKQSNLDDHQQEGEGVDMGKGDSSKTGLKGIIFPVGKDITTEFKESELYFHPSNTQLNQLNIGIVGDLGTGKTQLTKALIYRFVKSKKQNRNILPKFLIFDYKGDYLDGEFLHRVNGRVVEPNKIPLNLFDLSDREQLSNPVISTINFFNDIISKIYKIDKPNQKYLLKQAIKECYETINLNNNKYPTIYHIHDAYKHTLGENVDSTLSILSNMIDLELFETDASKVMRFEDFFKGVTVINLKALGQDDDTKNMLVIIFLNLFYDYMLKIPKRGFIGDDTKLRAIDSMLLVDEANSIMKYRFDVLDSILLQGREFGVGVLLASQYLSHFQSSHKDYKEPLLTWFIHKVPNIKKAELEKLGLSIIDEDIVERIKNLNLHECLYKTFDTSNHGAFIRGYPFYEII